MPLNHDPLDLIEGNFIPGAIVKLRCARAFVRRHELRILKRAAIVEIGSDPRRAEGMAANTPLSPASRARRWIICQT